jgi:hypothetical protein
MSVVRRSRRGDVSRRALLRRLGVGSAVLPFLGNLPSLARAAAAAGPKQRLIVVFSPDGVVKNNFWPAAGSLVEGAGGSAPAPLPTSLAGEFRHHAGPGGAEIDDGEAVWSVESSASSSSTIATARVEPSRLVAVAAQRKGAACKPGELARLERRHVSQSRPLQWQGGGQ